MDNLVILKNSDLKKLINKRSGESKFGEHVTLFSNVQDIYEQLLDLDVTYVILGIPEDIGVTANFGNTGTYKAWKATIKVLLNTQESTLNSANKVAILGHLDLSNARKKVSKLDIRKSKDLKKVRNIVSEIDTYVTKIIYDIVKAGKIPIVIGGGHNNAYGLIKGSSLALNKPINCVNFDAHTDFRKEEGRHSGNGFTYACSEGFLKNYFVFGLHENYTSQSVLEQIKKNKTIQYNTFEAISVRKELKFKTETKKALAHVSNTAFGIEIDCDAIVNIPSSAKTPSGFSVNRTRQFINTLANHEHAAYLHICEAAPKKKEATQVGKLISYLITDFIRAHG